MPDQTTLFNDVGAGWRELEPELTAVFKRIAAAGPYVLGPELEEFEREFAAFVGAAHCVGVNSGFDALQLTMRAWGIGAQDEVIVPALAPVATWMAVSFTGARPVGVDVDAATMLIDPDLVHAAVTEKTRAIVPVDLYGRPVALAPLVEIANAHDLHLLEDAAQAHGASRGGARVGGEAEATAFSFYPTKNLGAMGDGGAVTTDDAGLARHLRLLRTYGWESKDDPEIRGTNSRLDPLQAGFLRLKLERLEEWNERRRVLASRYIESLAGVSGLELPPTEGLTDSSWHLFVIAHDERDHLRRCLNGAGVDTLVHYPIPPHRTRAYGETSATFPVAERQASRVLSLPLYPQLSLESQETVVAALQSALGRPRPSPNP